MEIEFRKFSEFQRGTILELLQDGYSFEKRYERDWIGNWQEADDFFYDNLKIADACGFVTCLGGKPIGFISWDPRNMPDYVELGHNCIKTKYKGNKYGKKQLQEAIRRISEKRPKRILVTTDECLVPAQKNYESVGFQLLRHRENTINPEYAGNYIDYEMKLSNITYETKKDLPCDQLQKLFMAVGWSDGTETPFMMEHFNAPFLHSTIVISAWENGRLVGCIRVISDQVFRSIIYDLAVLPTYQGKGIGRELVRRCRACYPDSEWLVETIPERVSFYEQNGFSLNKSPFLSISGKWF